MATNDQNLTYDNIERPYDNDLARSESDVSAAATGVDPLAGGRTILSGQALTDAWIDTWIKSTNYEPKKRGFLIDGLKGYIEGMSIYISGSIVGGSLDIPDQLSANSFHVDALGNTWWGSNTAAGPSAATASIMNTGIAVFGLLSGPRVELNGNDAIFYDASAGGGGTISGDTASNIFRRTDYLSGHPEQFIVQKRKSIISNNGNVAEFFYDLTPSSGDRNYLFLGRQGNTLSSVTDFKTHIGTLAARLQIQVGSAALADNKGAWVIPPGPEFQIEEAALASAFNAGGSRIWALGMDSTTSAPLDIDTLGGGGATIIGMQWTGGQIPMIYCDIDGAWLAADLLPAVGLVLPTASISLGDPTHTFLSLHVNSINTRHTDNTLYGTIDTNAGWWRFASNNRNFLFSAGGGYTVYVNAAAIAPQYSGSGSCGLASNYWANVYTNNVSLSSSYINFQSGAITMHSDTSILGTLRATGALECSTARIRVGTKDFYVTADPDAPGQYYLRT